MANLPRSAKSGSDWTLNDLESYNINLNQQQPLEFFGMQVGWPACGFGTLTIFHITGVATAYSRSRATKHFGCRSHGTR